ncbi:MAG: class I SAM-dependent methyltransferase [Candidatus Eremiobacteraeota bacterium]|nr:class I SAM-dependent methyltransferase [Candidatus Eremiobacteraeota bacterium]
MARVLSRPFIEKIKAGLEKLGPSVEDQAASYWAVDRWELKTIPELKREMLLRVLALAKKMNLTGQDVILEVGCSDGSLCAELRQAGYNTIGLDIVLGEMGAEGKFIKGSIERLPLKSGSVKLVVDSFTLCYTDMERSADEILRVLLPGGMAFFMLHHPDRCDKALIRVLEENKIPASDFEAIWESEEDSAAFNCPTLRLLVNAFENNGAIAEFFTRKGFQMHYNDTEWLREGKNWSGLAYYAIVRKAQM